LLELKATDKERAEGLDLADLLMRFNYQDFITPTFTYTQKLQPPTLLTKVDQSLPPVNINYHSINVRPKSDSWSQELADLENYFASAVLPSNSLRLNSFSTITDCSLFVESHLSTLRQNNGKRSFMPYLGRLNNLRSILDADSNTYQSF
jgi:hypothetical protein